MAPPKDGDLPQIRLEVVTTPPVAELSKIEPDPTQRDALVLFWKASERHLGTNPVRLEWADRKDGTWKIIGEDLPNTGCYSWKLPPSIPPRV